MLQAHQTPAVISFIQASRHKHTHRRECGSVSHRSKATGAEQSHTSQARWVFAASRLRSVKGCKASLIGWTDGQTDTQRYKQLGNAVAVPPVEWIAKRITAAAQGILPLEPQPERGRQMRLEDGQDGLSLYDVILADPPWTFSVWNAEKI